MKRRLITLVAFAMLFVAAKVNGQDNKFGYTSVDFILNYMPDTKKVDSELKSYRSQLENSLKSKSEELQKKFEDYQKNAAKMAESVRLDKEKELQSLKNSLDELSVNAEKDYSNKQAKLLQPLYEKIQTAIEDVAKENGYTYIFSNTSLLYGPKDQGDISNLVFSKLGIDIPKNEN